MTEKEKMESGALYSPADKELLNDRIKAKKLCSEFNASEFNDFQKRERLLNRLVALKGFDTVIEPNFFCDYGYNIILGDNFYANHNLVILDAAEVTFGDNVFIGPNCGFYTSEHPIDAMTRNQGLEYAKPIKIGSDVWIGGNVTVLSGVTIGDNVVIGAGSVVTKDIPSNCVAAGNPCAPVKTIEAAPEKPAEPQKAERPAAPAQSGAAILGNSADHTFKKPDAPVRKRVELTRVDTPQNRNDFPDRRNK
ncbi:sugar O-acetyltransferase [Ruminococcus flavefaciens]|uniref:Acetyltransferase n=1 Tax=Ruminococcus flavefaciens 007c TaxID=1341157 RepID=W7UVT3_RUMFL|nr:hypothetical protein RF007C_15285 [Ruminococcus flavefaciens 007c]